MKEEIYKENDFEEFANDDNDMEEMYPEFGNDDLEDSVSVAIKEEPDISIEEELLIIIVKDFQHQRGSSTSKNMVSTW